MLRWVTLLASLLALADPAAAREVSVTIVEHGLYTAEVVGEQRDSSGVITDLLANLCHVATTDIVPMRPRVHFGFRYRVDGPDVGRAVDLTLAVTFPEAVHAPAGLTLQRHLRHSQVPGGAASYTGYSFDRDWEFVPGVWTLEVLQGERSLAALSFTVVDQALPALSFPDPSSCFKVSSL
ncbi:MAG: DUF3859 domain-containing protein [Alphaproteobacteria bacterium]|nr:DUF3859 domain-containing protein [Alphaproteobacteria bacterium]